MDIVTLCKEIDLQPEIKDRVLDCERRIDFQAVEKLLKDFLVYKNMKDACSGLQEVLHSCLLDPELRSMLREGSNIVSFQERFEIYDEGEADTEFIEWVFKKRPDIDYGDLPEDTSLQRNIKKHLLSGGVLRNAYGRIRDVPR